MQRCIVRCQDTAQESLPREPGAKDIEKAEAKLAKCMDACGSEYAALVPKLQSDIEATLKKASK